MLLHLLHVFSVSLKPALNVPDPWQSMQVGGRAPTAELVVELATQSQSPPHDSRGTMKAQLKQRAAADAAVSLMPSFDTQTDDGAGTPTAEPHPDQGGALLAARATNSRYKYKLKLL